MVVELHFMKAPYELVPVKNSRFALPPCRYKNKERSNVNASRAKDFRLIRQQPGTQNAFYISFYSNSCLRKLYYCPLRKGNVFTGVCLSTGGGA